VKPWLLLANPQNRRVTLFAEALAEAGHPAPQVISWLEYLRDPRVLEAVPDDERLVRVDSFGEDFEVEKLLLARGGFPNAATLVENRGEVIAPRVAHEGFLEVLSQLGKLVAKRPRWRLLNALDEISELFDKRRTSRRFRDAGIPVPDFLDEVPTEPGALLDAARARGWKQLFVKPSMGSSASGVLLVSLTARTAEIRTSLEWDAPRWFNNLKLSHYRTKEAVHRALGFVLAQGAQVELAIPKATLDEAFFDLRVLCIAGEPRFIVVRQNRHPITNLHLGGWRGDVEKLRAAMQPAQWDAMLETCRRTAGLYRSLHVGLDVMFEPGFDRHRVIEANAFGDLLPNLTLDGKSVYRWEIDAAVAAQSAGTRSSKPAPKTLPSSR